MIKVDFLIDNMIMMILRYAKKTMKWILVRTRLATVKDGCLHND